MKIVVNEDKEVVNYIRKRLKENDGYCPCKLVKSEENRCICKEFLAVIERGETGQCHCGLYILEDE